MEDRLSKARLIPIAVCIYMTTLFIAAPNLSAIPQWLNYSGSLEFFASDYDIRLDSQFNPENRVAEIQDWDVNTYLRSHFNAEFDLLSLNLQPRYAATRSKTNEAFDNTDELYFQEWNMSLHKEHWQFVLSQEIIFWGPSQFSSPSNPYYASTNQINPFVELDARQFARIDSFISDSLTLSVITNYDAGRDNSITTNFEAIHSLKLDKSWSNVSSSIILSTSENVNYLGLYGQWNTHDAIMTFFDVGIKDNSLTYLIQPGESGRFHIKQRQHDNNVYVDAVAGFTYTTAGGSTWGLEYRRNSDGYHQEEQTFFFETMSLIDGKLRTGELLTATEQHLLEISPNPGSRTLSQQYLYAQYFKRDVITDLSLNFLLSHNLDDHSSQATSVINYYLNENWGIAANFTYNMGKNNKSEFKTYIDSVLFFGVKRYF